eukprot:Hpha_TRINITY_DN11809_c0_g1::TRINITY_DN11809_c0_g1_i1::g.2080::m.2080
MNAYVDPNTSEAASESGREGGLGAFAAGEFDETACDSPTADGGEDASEGSSRVGSDDAAVSPPPGSFVAVIHTLGAEEGGKKLAVTAGERLTVVDAHTSSVWWLLRNSRGDIGAVPASYVRVVSVATISLPPALVPRGIVDGEAVAGPAAGASEASTPGDEDCQANFEPQRNAETEAEAEAEAQRKAEAEAQRKAEAEAQRKAEAEAQRK